MQFWANAQNRFPAPKMKFAKSDSYCHQPGAGCEEHPSVVQRIGLPEQVMRDQDLARQHAVPFFLKGAADRIAFGS